MYNISSPITPMNNSLGGFQSPPNFYSQSNGNLIGIGTYGYNGNPMMSSGGYYNHNYNTIYNPYLAEQQRRAEEAKALENAKQKADVMKMISRKVNHSLGNVISDERLKNLYDPQILRTSESDLIMQTSFRLIEIDQYNLQYPFVYQDPLYVAMGRVQEKNMNKIDPSIDLYEFLNNGGEMISNIIKEEVIGDASKKVQALYNKKDYQKLIQERTNGGISFSNTFNPNANIDDMEISLPQHMKNEYARRKAEFMEKIINRAGV